MEGVNIKKILLAGSTGYLGTCIALALQKKKHFYRVVVRSPEKLQQNKLEANEVIQAELTDRDSIKDSCRDMDVVISTVGITRQKEGYTYMEVDFQANMNLLEEAIKSGVEKFIYISVLNGDKLRDLKVCAAKELFVEQLKKSGIDYCIIRPNGFFSDMSEFFNMAQRGRIYLFGNGELRANPIHGADLAEVCIDAVGSVDKEIEAGGPEVLSQNKIAQTAFEVLGRKKKITHIPDWIRRFVLTAVRFFTTSRVYGPVEFFLTVMAMDMVAPAYGTRTLKEHFTGLKNTDA